MRPSRRSWRQEQEPERPVFQGFGSDRFRTAITRACPAAGIPALSPHDLRHRRVSLLHLGGMPWARIGEMVGHGDVVATARTYTHVMAVEDGLRLRRAALLSLWPRRVAGPGAGLLNGGPPDGGPPRGAIRVWGLGVVVAEELRRLGRTLLNPAS